MPASLRIATLLPDCAMRVRRPALPLRLVAKVEKVSFWGFARQPRGGEWVRVGGGGLTVLSSTRWSRALS